MAIWFYIATIVTIAIEPSTRPVYYGCGGETFGGGCQDQDRDTAALLVPAIGWAGPPQGLDDPGPGIFDGMTVPQCGWPTAVSVTSGGGLCTGTLVHPRVVIYAAQ